MPFTTTYFPDMTTITYAANGSLQIAIALTSPNPMTITNSGSIVGVAYVAATSPAKATFNMLDKTNSAVDVMELTKINDGLGGADTFPIISFKKSVASFSMPATSTITINCTNGSTAILSDNTADTTGIMIQIPSTNTSTLRIGSGGLLKANGGTFALTTPKNSFDDGTNGNMIASGFLQVQNSSHLYSGSGGPSVSAAAGDLYFRTDTPSTVNQRIYVNTATGNNWSGVV